MPEAKVYLGDGVYYETKPGFVVLTTENGVSVTNEIFLHNEVLEALLGNLGIDFDHDKLCAAIRKESL